jgi:predicted RNA-binding Zn-ribbon protein involved in translation (DUF1610 family)
VKEFELAHPYCPSCGYDLSGLEHDELDEFVCPECGRRITHKESMRIPIYLSDPIITSIVIALIPSILIGIGLGTRSGGFSPDRMLFTGVLSLMVVLIGTICVSSHYKKWKGPKPRWSRHRLCMRVFIHALLAMLVLTVLVWWLINAKVSGGLFG